MDNNLKQLPLRIYLDTSDYSGFADIGYRNEPGLPDILNFLREKKEQGLIEFRFSAVHLFEFLKDPTQRDLALRKARVMEELCGDCAFRFFGDVFELEREALRSGTDPASLVISDEGEWCPPVEPEDSFSLGAIIRGLQEQFPILDAAEIRASIASPEAVAYLKENMSREFPLAKVYGAELIDRFLANKLSGPELSRELVKDFTKPSTLIEHYLEGKSKAQEAFGMLAQREQKLHKALVEAREKLKPLIKFVLSLDQRAITEIRRYVKKLIVLDPSASHLGTDELPTHLQQALEQGRFLRELPALSVHCNLLTAYLRDINYPSSMPPEIKESDAGDIFHAIYLPYVDLYRTDGRFGALLNKIPKPSNTKVVPKLRQLPKAVEEQLAERSRA